MKTRCISKIVLSIIGFAVLTAYSGQWEVFTNKNDVQDIALSGNTLWAATTGGVVAWDLDDNSYTCYTTADRLSSCNINQVTIDQKGRTWVATIEPVGLFVYENQAWEQIKVGGADNEIGDKIISGLEADQFGNVWVYPRDEDQFYQLYDAGGEVVDGGEVGYLWRYDGQAWYKHEGVYGPLALDPQKKLLAVDSLIIPKIPEANSVDTARFRIVSFNGSEFVCKWSSKVDHWFATDFIALACIALDSKGNSWISSYGERWGETFGVVYNNTLYNTLDGLADDNVRSITADGSGAVWCATDGGISKFTGNSWVTYDTADGIASNRVYTVIIGKNNTRYAATSKGISILESNQWKTLKTINEPLHNNYTDMVIDKKGAVILAGNDHIAMYDDLKWKLNHFGNIRLGDLWYHHFPPPGTRPDKIFSNNKSFFKSKDGTLYALGNEGEKGWILKQGTDRSSFVKAFFCTLEKSESIYRPNRIQSPIAICSGNDSCFWVTDAHNNLILFNKQNTVTFSPSDLGIRSDNITSMLPDRDGGSVWIGYRDDGVTHFDGETIKKRIYKKDDIVSDEITAIARDSSGNLWFASVYIFNGGGVSVLRDSKLTKYLNDHDGKVFGCCNTLFVDKSGNVWAHTHNGIARFDGNSWKLFDSTAVSPDLPYARYSHIIQDKLGTVWFGTEGSGLLAYKKNNWYQFTTHDGIPHNSIRSCAVDSKNNLWILTDNGVAMCKLSEMVHFKAQHNFVNPGNKQIIQQSGNRFYISSNNAPDMIRYVLFDLRGKTMFRQTIHHRKSFVLPENLFGSGIWIVSITLENSKESQNTYFFKIRDLNK